MRPEVPVLVTKVDDWTLAVRAREAAMMAGVMNLIIISPSSTSGSGKGKRRRDVFFNDLKPLKELGGLKRSAQSPKRSESDSSHPFP